MHGAMQWLIRVVPPKAKYGSKDQVINVHKEPIVDFFDKRHGGFNDLGFLSSQYLLSTILEDKGGLCLSGSYPAQYVDDEFMASLHDWLKTLS